jgi:hypothetical protein
MILSMKKSGKIIYVSLGVLLSVIAVCFSYNKPKVDPIQCLALPILLYLFCRPFFKYPERKLIVAISLSALIASAIIFVPQITIDYIIESWGWTFVGLFCVCAISFVARKVKLVQY